jgi:transposase InsO family protein
VIYAAIADWAAADAYPVDFMCRQLDVSRSGYYKWRGHRPSAREQADQTLRQLVKKLFAVLNKPGVRRLQAELRVRGWQVSKKRVWRLMRLCQLAGRHPRTRKKTTIQSDRPQVAPDLVGRQFTAEQPNQKWCGDITYVKTWRGWAYLATVIDLYSRKLVGWAVADHLETSLVIDALAVAVASRRPDSVIFHSDRAVTSGGFARFCAAHNITRSLGRTGDCFDNAVAESFNATYKKELVCTRPQPDMASLRKATFEWVERHYNRTRRHSYLGYLTIEEFELGYTNIDQLAA